MTTRVESTVPLLALMVTLACASSPPGPPPPDTPPTGCTEPRPGPGYECVRDCGPPVVSEDDPPPGWSWLTAEQAEGRRQHGCPVCLPGTARIATPNGPVPIAALRAGDAVWTLDARGARVPGVVRHVASRPAAPGQQVVRVVLADGRVVVASAGHPRVGGGTLGTLTPGARLDGARVNSVTLEGLEGGRTFDVLPEGATGAYWADGVLLGSSLAAQPVTRK